MEDRGGRQITLAEVARVAGVSPATASRVLHGGGRVVRPDLSDRVQQAALALRYVPNAHAQALAHGGTSTVGLIMHDVSDPYFGAITRGAMEVAAEHGTLVMLGSTFRSPTRELEYVSTFRAQRAQAILVVGSGFSDAKYLSGMRTELAHHREAGGRYAFVSHHDLPGDAVLPDNREGAAAIAHALLDLGHRHFAVAAGPSALTTVEHRLTGFVESLTRAGVPAAQVDVIEGEFSENGGYSVGRRIAATPRRATALFCTSDVMAIGALTALHELDVAVPDELSVIGFDDIPVVRHLRPALSTAHLDLEGMGRAAMELVLAPQAGEERHVRFAAEVVLRDSTGPPPQR